MQSATRKYNNAIRKAARLNPETAEFLPEVVSYKELKADITSARALKNKVNSLLRVRRPGALSMVSQADSSVVTRYERGEAAILKSVRNRLKKQDALRRGVKGNEMTISGARASTDKRDVTLLSATSLRTFIKTAERDINTSSLERAGAYWRNYMLALYSVFGGFEEYDAGLARIQNKILALAKYDYDAMRDAIDDAPDIGFIYEPLERAAKWEVLKDYWNSVEAPTTRDVE